MGSKISAKKKNTESMRQRTSHKKQLHDCVNTDSIEYCIAAANVVTGSTVVGFLEDFLDPVGN